MKLTNTKAVYLFLKLAVYIIVLAGLLYYLYNSPYNPHPASVEDIRRWVSGFGSWAPVIYILIYTFRPIFFFPTLLMNLSAGILFGPYLGIVFLLAGGLGCSMFCYLLGRFGGGRWLLENFGGRIGERVRGYLLNENSFTKMLWLRTVPVFPYDPVSVLAGSVKLPCRIYVASTFLGMLPGAVAYNFLADSFGSSKFYLAVAVTVLAFGIPLFLWQRFGENKKIGRGE